MVPAPGAPEVGEQREGMRVDRLDGAAVRAWARAAARDLDEARGSIDLLNVFPVPDGDTGTNLSLTVAQGADEVDALPGPATAPEAMRAFARGALLGARGSSGVILSQFLLGLSRGLAQGVPGLPDAAREPDAADGVSAGGLALAGALDAAQAAARTAVAKPVEGTILTAATAAARAARAAAGEGADLAATATAALAGASDALARTPDDLDVLRSAGVVDAGASGLVVLLGSLVGVITGQRPTTVLGHHVREARGDGDGADVHDVPGTEPTDGCAAGADGEFEVMFLLEAATDIAADLSARLQALGESVAVVGGPDVWQAHVHTDDPAGAIAAGGLGRRRQVTVRHLGVHAHAQSHVHPQARGGRRTGLGLVVGTGAPGLVAELARVGAVVMVHADEPATTAGVLRAVVDSAAPDVLVLPGSPSAGAAARAVTGTARARGRQTVHVVEADDDVRVTAGLAAALAAVPDVGAVAPPDVTAAVAAVARAVGAVRTAEVTAAEDPADVRRVVDALLSPGGEVLTVLRGARAADGTLDALTAALVDHVAAAHPGVDVVVLEGGQAEPLLALGAE
ncbi:DAK2 domain-containing protein [Cellulomonas fimi]|uniref:DAK2 domain-containing protein n=1 Tax=Cellulomonas fimi TaxID=1708 RepID=A0A7Y0QIG7_CELFI|nr:DAK2 domain-containing protein [Cellulomonas fimi]NMR21183.1 DAK2 domain-containing protein [Cellulomonas fimi]